MITPSFFIKFPLAALPAGSGIMKNDNGVLGPIVTMSIIGTIDNATVFAGGINESDACPFNGGAG